jgi:hypothetical protein
LTFNLEATLAVGPESAGGERKDLTIREVAGFLALRNTPMGQKPRIEGGEDGFSALRRKCKESVPVHKVFRGKTVWRGKVEVFDLSGHPKALRCYAWSHPDGPRDQDEKFIAVLETPPITSPKRAVQAAIVSQSKLRLR